MNDILLKLFEPIDQYCERTDQSLLSEPLNFLSNFGFIIVAWLILRLREKAAPHKVKELNILAALAFSVGIGSALFHSFANRLSLIGDILPIAILVFVSLGFYVRDLKCEGIALPRFLLTSFASLILPPTLAKIFLPADALAKGEAYLGLAPTLLVFAWMEKNKTRRHAFFLASFVFAIALVFRTIDNPICDTLRIGTHFLWHILTSVCAYLMAYALGERGTNARDEQDRG